MACCRNFTTGRSASREDVRELNFADRVDAVTRIIHVDGYRSLYASRYFAMLFGAALPQLKIMTMSGGYGVREQSFLAEHAGKHAWGPDRIDHLRDV